MAYLPILESAINGTLNLNEDNSEERKKSKIRLASPKGNSFVISDYGIESPPEEAPEKSVAILNISDVITKYDQWCGPSGTKTKADLLLRSNANDNIKAILLNIDSGGGEGYASMDLSAIIKNQITKPVVAFVDDLAASAAYNIASSADRVVLKNNISAVGSIGTYVTIADYRQHYESKGIKLFDVYASLSTDKNKGYRDALNGDFEQLRADIDKFNNEFLASVELFRGQALKSERTEWGTGKVFYGKEAIDRGLADEIDSFQNTLQSLINL